MSDETTDILLKADALMRRSRSYVAVQAAPSVKEGPANAVSSTVPDQHPDDDIPVLTEKVTENELALATAPPHLQNQLEDLREELAAWLEQELPQAVLKVTDGLADQLVGELTNQAEKNLLPRLIARLDGGGKRQTDYSTGTES